MRNNNSLSPVSRFPPAIFRTGILRAPFLSMAFRVCKCTVYINVCVCACGCQCVGVHCKSGLNGPEVLFLACDGGESVFVNPVPAS